MADAMTTDSKRECAPCDSSADTDIDRQFERSDVFNVAEVRIYPLAGQSGEPIYRAVMVRNLSRHGFGITLDDPLQPRQRVELHMEQQRLVGEVQWSRQIQPKIHLVGCRLLSSA
jgi:hypothetical protein